ncbi:MAG: hypothetical protein HY537_06645 [Deltaproteobacteria bacterium]|nr:hypothetical protein [Deltaproteobacteria bacterium]
MTFSFFVILWLVITVLLSVEFYLLNTLPSLSVCHFVQSHTGLFDGLSLSPEPGRPISWLLGCAGFTFMLLTNLYIIRKRVPLFANWGRLSGWLNVHIFFGLLGPTLIIFHSNFKVRGLVSVSFWSMIISAVSGIVGRYFYIQLLRQGSELEQISGYCADYLEKARAKVSSEVSEQALTVLKERALRWAGVPKGPATSLGLLGALAASVIGDVRLMIMPPRTSSHFPVKTRYALEKYALANRRLFFIDYFQQLMGYWHAFHIPFAVFMYLVGVIHIVVAVLFSSGH